MEREQELRVEADMWEQHFVKENGTDPHLHDAFIAGAQREAGRDKWISVEDRTPITYQDGDWDGLRSDFVLAVDKSDNYVIARVYEGKMDGTQFVDWVNSKDYLLDLKVEQIVKWQYLPEKF